MNCERKTCFGWNKNATNRCAVCKEVRFNCPFYKTREEQREELRKHPIREYDKL